MKTNHTLCCALTVLAALSAPAVYAQQFAPVDEVEGINLIGLGVASVPDYSGSSHNKAVPAPIVRYQLAGTERYFLWLGPTMTFNVLNDQNWRVGPLLNYRAKRNDDVEDDVVKRMDQIDSTVEGGLFAKYNVKLSDRKFHQVSFEGDVAGGDHGVISHLRTMYWHPFTPTLIGDVGLGASFGDGKFNRTYYGVQSAHDISLFPSLGGRSYDPGSGLIGVNIPFGLTYFINKEWLVTVAGRYESLQGDVKDSPVVSQRGKSDQWIGGIAVSYAF